MRNRNIECMLCSPGLLDQLISYEEYVNCQYLISSCHYNFLFSSLFRAYIDMTHATTVFTKLVQIMLG